MTNRLPTPPKKFFYCIAAWTRCIVPTNSETQVPVDREISNHRTGETAPDRTLVEAEPRRRRAYLGREALGEITRRLAPNAAAGKPSLQPEEHDDHPVVVGEQIERDERQPDQCGQDYRPAAANAVRRPTPNEAGPELSDTQQHHRQ